MITSVKVRLEPNNRQRSRLFQSAGVARWAYNWALSRQEENYRSGNKFLSDYDLRKELTQLKKTEALKWLHDYSNNITKQAIKDACQAYLRFFKKLSSKPRFKSKRRSPPKFYNDCHKIRFLDSKVRLEKIGWVRLSEKQRIPTNAKYLNPRIMFDGVNWFISVSVEKDFPKVQLTDQSIGIDLGIKHLAVCSNLDVPFRNINKSRRVKRAEKRLRRLQRKVSNKYQKGESYAKTSNIIGLENKLKKLHRYLANVRTDYLHKVTTQIVKTKPSRVVMESLDVRGMVKNRHLAKAVSQQGLQQFKRMMQYKCANSGIEFVEVSKWFPSSKLCSDCGYVKPRLSLSERQFICECCGSVLDRDRNAAINLSRYKAS